MKKKKGWIQRAIKKPGSLRAYVQRKYGKAGFTKSGTIKKEVLDRLAKRNDTIGRRARLAKALRTMGK